MSRLLLLAAILSSAGHAATFTVDTTDNGNLSACTAAAADCSYNGAVTRANNAGGADVIAFDIPLSDTGCSAGTGVCRIQFASALATIGGPLTIDGYTQPGASANTLTPDQGGSNAQLKIELRGCPSCGFGILCSAPVTLRGLAIGGFSGGAGVWLDGNLSNGSIVEGNFIGTDASGTVAVPNGNGINASGNPAAGAQPQNLRIGGALPAQRNLISGNNNNGIDSNGTGLQILGNLIGTNASGLVALPNVQIGVFIAGCGNDSGGQARIGGLTVGDRNIVSGNGNYGVQIGLPNGGCGSTVGALIRGNYLGASANGVGIIGNGLLDGFARGNVLLRTGGSAGAPNVVGGSEAGAGNLVVGAVGSGVELPSDAFAAVFGNRMRDNRRLGIDGGSGAVRELNDAGDADNFFGGGFTGRNQNFPVISAYSVGGGNANISYRIDSTPANSVYPLRVDFYQATGDEGGEYLGSDVYSAAEAQTVKAIVLPIPPGLTLSADDVIVATATDAEFNTSEFSFHVLDGFSIVSSAPEPSPAGTAYTVSVRADAVAGSAVGASIANASAGHSIAAAPCIVNQKTWDGGGASNNWSEAANWTCDAVPLSTDDVFFNATSTKDATINTNVTAQVFRMNAGYTGAISQGSSNLTVVAGITQTTGTFNGGSGSIDSAGGFTLSGGTFNAGGATLLIQSGFTITSAATFNAQTSTVVFNRAGSTVNVDSAAVPNSANFHNIRVDHGGFASSIQTGDVLLATGTVELVTGGIQGGTIEARGAVIVAPTFTQGSSSTGGILAISGSAARTVSIPGGAVMPGLTLNAANVSLGTTGAGTIRFKEVLRLQAGTIDQGSVNLLLFTNSESLLDQSGGTFNGGSGAFAGNIAISGGVFNGGSGVIDCNGPFSVTGGTFNGGNAILQTSAAFTVSSAATFNPDALKIVFDGGGGPVTVNSTATPNALLVNKVEISRAGSALELQSNQKLIVAGLLELTSGGIANGVVEALGDVTMGSIFNAGFNGKLIFAGAANQSFANPNNTAFGNVFSSVTIDKSPLSTVTVNGGLFLSTGSFPATLNIVAGTLLLGANANLTTGSLTIGANGQLVNDSATTITLGGDVSNAGVIDLQGGGAACPQSDSVLIRSSNTTQRSWNTVGLGRYRLIDVDVQRMGGTGTKTVFSGTDSIPGSNSASWVFNPGCPVELSVTPSTAGVQTGGTQSFTAGGGFAPLVFSVPVNNSGASINSSSGLYTAGATPGVTDSVRVTDSFGSTADASVSTFAAANRLAFVVQPVGSVAGQAISPPIQVAVRDSFGNLVSNSSVAVTLSIANNPGNPFGNLSGTLTRNAVAGIATFNGISIERAAAGYTLLALSGSLTNATSTAFDIVPAAPSQLRFIVEPTDTNVNQVITPAVQISILDQFNNLVVNATNPITIEAEIVGPVPVAGTTTRNAIGGIATFNDLSISTVSSLSDLCELIALSPGLPSQRSNPPGFNVIGPSRLAFAVQPTNTQAGATITPPVQVEIQDQFGLFLPNASNAITISGDAFHDLSGTLTRTAINGIATFDDLSLSFNATVPLTQLAAAAPTLQTAGSATFSILSPLAVTNTNDSGGGSLRQTILNANALAGDPAITFAITGLGPHQIDLSSALPTITTPMIIDGGIGAPGIVLNGANAGATADGLRIDAPSVRIKGFVIQRFGGNGINLLANARLTTIQGNYIGTNAAGDAAQPNAGAGIQIGIGASDNDIGGTLVGLGNVLSGNNTGIKIMSDNNRVEGNFIGTNAAANAAIPNVRGIEISGASSNVIGGGNFGSRNIISGNTLSAIIMHSGAGSSLIVDNYIGTDVSGFNPLANGSGISMGEGSGNTIAVNVIAHNGGRAVTISSGTENSIVQNSIHSNSGLGIDLLPTGITPNDPGDADLGANKLLNYPVLTSATSSGGNTTVRGSLNSLPSQSYSLDFYSSAACDASGFGEGETFIGSTIVSTDASGIASFTATVNSATAIGRFITATASNPTSGPVSTSEFSRCQIVAIGSFEISGRVTDNIGNGLSGVDVRNTTTGIGVISRPDGGYTFTNVPGGRTHVIRPSLANTLFTPDSRTFSNLSSDQFNQNFTGTVVRARISGQVLSAIGASTFALSGATVSLSGGASAVTTTDVNGSFAFDTLLPGNYSVTPSKPNFTFSPPTRNLVVGANQSASFVGSITPFLDGRVIFDSDSKVFSMNADGSARTAIVTIAGASCDQTSLSRNGRKIAFRCLSSGSVLGGPINTLYSANSDGSNLTTLATSGSSSVRDSYPAWSPDGARIAFTRRVASGFGFISSLRTMNADGTAVSTVFSGPQGREELQSPSWSADGSAIAFSRRNGAGASQIFWVPVSGGVPAQLTSNPQVNASAPVFSPDGTRIVFRRAGSSSLPGAASVMNTDGSGQTGIAAGSSFSSLTWSPDGFRLGFVKQIGGFNYGVMDTAGNNPVSFTDKVAHPSWAAEPAFQTSTGSNVNVSFGATSITFNSVGTAGTTSITPIPPGSAGTVPGGFTVGSFAAYEISTTAAFNSPVTVCFTVPSSVLQLAFNRLNILHNEGGVLVNRTSSRNFALRQVCAVVTTLSPFAIAEEIDVNLPRIAGLLLDANGIPIIGATVRATGAEDRATTSNSDGSFNFVNLTAGGNYNIQPRQLGHLFSEYNQDFIAVAGEQSVVFTGTATVFQINGQIVDQLGVGVAGVSIELDGSTEAVATTDVNGNYSFTDLPADGFYGLTPVSGPNSFMPGQTTIDPLTSDAGSVDFIMTVVLPDPLFGNGFE